MEKAIGHMYVERRARALQVARKLLMDSRSEGRRYRVGPRNARCGKISRDAIEEASGCRGDKFGYLRWNPAWKRARTRGRKG